MELNREQIIKALECCSNNTGDCPDFCPLRYDTECVQDLAKNALALTTSQEQRIKELAEENERLKSIEFTCGFIKPHKVLECPIFDEVERTKADTVRSMQERLIKWWKAQIEVCVNAKEEEIIIFAVDQIAKEMLEGEK